MQPPATFNAAARVDDGTGKVATIARSGKDAAAGGKKDQSVFFTWCMHGMAELSHKVRRWFSTCPTYCINMKTKQTAQDCGQNYRKHPKDVNIFRSRAIQIIHAVFSESSAFCKGGRFGHREVGKVFHHHRECEATNLGSNYLTQTWQLRCDIA
jgi:hypothetical protein